MNTSKPRLFANTNEIGRSRAYFGGIKVFVPEDAPVAALLDLARLRC